MANKKHRIIVVGGGYAGTMAAIRLGGMLKKENVEVTLIDGSPVFRERVRYHQIASGQKLPLRPYTQMLRGTGTKFRQAWVQRIDPNARQVIVATPAGEEALEYDTLFYAAGSRFDLESVPGVAEFAQSLNSLHHSQALAAAIRNQGRAVIVGGGLTSIELATELAETHPQLKVTLVTQGHFAGQFSDVGERYIRQQFDRLNIDLLEHQSVRAVRADHLDVAGQAAIPFDVCIWAGGFVGATLAAESGLPVNGRGQLMVDEQLRVREYPNIYGIGDSAYMDDTLRMSCAVAVPMGAHAALHFVNQFRGKAEPRPFDYGYMIWCVSLGRKAGIVQRVNQQDRPIDKIYTGWLAARIKEIVVRSTVWSLAFERWLPGSFVWPRLKTQQSVKESQGQAYVSGKHI